ncbi:TonB-dependent receptor [candidate division KSB1 bacterium]|nr:TonB-dependent receptor [candidate division KSB1 bacterium]
MRQFINLSKIYFLILLTSSTVWSQSVVKITGVIRDRSTGRPLYGANVMVEGTGYGVCSDERGRYVIKDLFVGEYNLTASYIGYKNETKSRVKIGLDQPLRVDFYLAPRIIEFPGITLRVDRVPEETAASVEVITARDIEQTNAQNVGEILQHLSAIEIQDRGGEKIISIRGCRPDQVLVLLDGVKLNEAMIGQVDLSTIPLNMVEKIEVIKGGNSARFGAGALGGVINITTKRSFKSEIILGGKAGAFGAEGGGPTISGNLKKLGYFVSFEHLKSTRDYPYLYERADGTLIQENRNNADFESNSLFAKFGYQWEYHGIELHGHQFYTKRGLPGLIFGLTPYARAVTKRDILGGHYRAQLKPARFDLHMGYHLTHSEYKHIYPPDAPLRYRTVPQYYSKNCLAKYQIRLTSQVFLKRWVILRSGYEGDWTHYADENLIGLRKRPIGEARDYTHGVTLHSEQQFPFPVGFHRGFLSQAVRYDQIHIQHEGTVRSERQWSPKIGLLLSRGQQNKISLKANWGRSFRPPTFADLFYQEYRVAGRPDLKPERSLDYEIGLGGSWYGWGELQTEASHFYTRVKDLIVWRLGSFATFSPFNTDAEISGQEYHLSWCSPNDILILRWSRTYLEPINKSNERTTHNKDLPYRPRKNIRLGVDLRYKIFQLQYQRRVIGERYVTEANTVKMPGYGVDDLTVGVSTKAMGVHIQIRGSVYNLGNVKYEMVERAPVPPREWRIGLTLKVKN